MPGRRWRRSGAAWPLRFCCLCGPTPPACCPGRSPAPPSAPLSPGAMLRAPGLLGRSLRLGCWSAGRRAAAGKSVLAAKRVLRLRAVSRRLSRPASALATARAAVPRSPYPPSRCAAIARVGAPLPLPRARRIRSCGRVPLTSVPWLIRAAGQRPCWGSFAGCFPDRAWKALNGWAAGYVLLWRAYPLPWMVSRRENFYRRMGCFPAYAGKLYFI